MRRLWKLVASPRHLMTFESAARLASFTKAANELNVQQPAVSAAIKQLETALGVQLFLRGHRKVELTQAGARFYADVSRALGDILGSAQTIHQKAILDHVTLNVSSAFAYYWVMPRLADLHLHYPHIDLRVQSSDHEPEIEAEGIDLSVRCGDGVWEGCNSALIAPEVIFPIASPRVMQSAINLATIPNLLHEKLIHLEEPIRDRPSWADWFAHHGVQKSEPAAGLRMNDYALVLQAAIAGEGFAFGWEHVTRGLIEQGVLAAREDWSWRTGKGFYLVWSATKPLGPDAIAVRDWMIGAAKS